MTMKCTRLWPVLLLGGLLAFSHASAQPSAPAPKAWLGASLGQSRFDDSIARGLFTTGTVDAKSMAYKVFGGYQFFRYVGVEVAYVDLGNLVYSGEFSGTPIDNGKVSVKGIDISAIGTVALSDRISAFGKLGVYAWEAHASDVAPGATFNARNSGHDASFGVGLGYAVTRFSDLRAEFEQFRIGDDKAGLFSVGITFKF
jgi:OOP family OmpA-OmpF porin